MIVITVPYRLKLAASALFLCIPLIALEVMIANRASWWNLPYRSIGYWSLAFTLICIPLSAWIVGARRWAYPLAVLLVGLWVISSTWVSIRMRYPPLGFFTLFLSGFFVVELLWLKFELGRSFFDPQMSWYKGLPKPIPGLKCHLAWGDSRIELRVSRIDSEGAFVFTQVEFEKTIPVLTTLSGKNKLEVSFSFRNHQVNCFGRPTLAIHRGLGLGIQFFDVSPDLHKEIGDFVEILKGEGYV
jgi:hypothetical protein